jgi:hypothetical protein
LAIIRTKKEPRTVSSGTNSIGGSFTLGGR